MNYQNELLPFTYETDYKRFCYMEFYMWLQFSNKLLYLSLCKWLRKLESKNCSYSQITPVYTIQFMPDSVRICTLLNKAPCKIALILSAIEIDYETKGTFKHNSNFTCVPKDGLNLNFKITTI